MSTLCLYGAKDLDARKILRPYGLRMTPYVILSEAKDPDARKILRPYGLRMTPCVILSGVCHPERSEGSYPGRPTTNIIDNKREQESYDERKYY